MTTLRQTVNHTSGARSAGKPETHRRTRRVHAPGRTHHATARCLLEVPLPPSTAPSLPPPCPPSLPPSHSHCLHGASLYLSLCVCAYGQVLSHTPERIHIYIKGVKKQRGAHSTMENASGVVWGSSPGLCRRRQEERAGFTSLLSYRQEERARFTRRQEEKARFTRLLRQESKVHAPALSAQASGCPLSPRSPRVCSLQPPPSLRACPHCAGHLVWRGLWGGGPAGVARACCCGESSERAGRAGVVRELEELVW